ncbi:hypothetical protein [Wolbachia endosymbiont of Folsomia candida]|uniref:hypothetical protein n=1 Tax=Wolbachia endosymbiont of Folsomia candida TaxID=169402 RepID=UPI000AA97B0C|nr:hypothetical protein [Wolbachia endosymbiont of Folsomia candida]APR98540.1 hypothetical protein ASM33_04760 [Wolbachia endosymbiont of Folsomia candida]
MENDTNTKSKKSNNTLYYTAFSLIAFSSCAAAVILKVAPYVEFLAPVAGFATPPAFIALVIIFTISALAILYKLFSRSNTISQEAKPVEKEEVVEKCDNAGQPAVVASAPVETAVKTRSDAEQPEQVTETLAGSGSGAEQVEQPNQTEKEKSDAEQADQSNQTEKEKPDAEQVEQPNQTEKGQPNAEQAKQPEKAKGWGDFCRTSLSSMWRWTKSGFTTAKEWTYDPACKGAEYVEERTGLNPGTVAGVAVCSTAVGAYFYPQI